VGVIRRGHHRHDPPHPDALRAQRLRPGGNAEAARIAGVNVGGVQAITFVLLATSAAVAGVLNSSRSLSAQPSDDFSFVFAVLTAVIVGGTSIAGGQGAIWRTVAGAFFLAFMSNGFNLHQIDPIWQRLIMGLVILIAVGIDAWTQRNSR
jgi:ribose transport system permease protein